MRGAINLLGVKLEIDEIQYKITNINFIPNSSTFYIELESDEGLLNISLKDLSSHLNEQINLKNGNGRKKHINS
tara:strand:- start:448 stop:669 length:222 start_codon:yes stop_codon:yes gene_type:complete